MANVVLFEPVPFVTNIEPGQDIGIYIGPMDAFANSTITVTAAPYEPIFETTSISVQETTLQWRSSGDRIVWATLRNTSAVRIRSFYVFVSCVGR